MSLVGAEGSSTCRDDVELTELLIHFEDDAAKNQDVLQLGGALVVAPNGKVKLVHRSSDVNDNVPVDTVLGALA